MPFFGRDRPLRGVGIQDGKHGLRFRGVQLERNSVIRAFLRQRQKTQRQNGEELFHVHFMPSLVASSDATPCEPLDVSLPVSALACAVTPNLSSSSGFCFPPVDCKL